MSSRAVNFILPGLVGSFGERETERKRYKLEAERKREKKRR